MTPDTSDQAAPAVASTAAATAAAANPWPLYGLCLGFLIVCMVGAWNDRQQGMAIAALQTELAAIKSAQQMFAQQMSAVSVPVDPASPDPVPARPGVPRVALRPSQPPAPENAPAGVWGVTDLDREIDAFSRSLDLETFK